MGYELNLVTEEERYNYMQVRLDFKTLIYMADGHHDAKILNECLYGIATNNSTLISKTSAKYITKSNGAKVLSMRLVCT